MEFLQGRGQIIPGLEQALYGMSVDDEKDVVVEVADGYGDRDPEAFEEVAHDVFPPGTTLNPGMGLRMRDSSGRALIAYVGISVLSAVSWRLAEAGHTRGSSRLYTERPCRKYLCE